jgi:hypothetical protein
MRRRVLEEDSGRNLDATGPRDALQAEDETAIEDPVVGKREHFKLREGEDLRGVREQGRERRIPP